MSIKGLNMIGPHHICVLYVATAGLQGPLMGSDEQEIVLLIYVIVDVIQNKVRIAMDRDNTHYLHTHCACTRKYVGARGRDENSTKIPGCERRGR